MVSYQHREKDSFSVSTWGEDVEGEAILAGCQVPAQAEGARAGLGWGNTFVSLWQFNKKNKGPVKKIVRKKKETAGWPVKDSQGTQERPEGQTFKIYLVYTF